jgi:pyruvate/2-oxoglutarate dehydrogenase complex dihydrolipoamide dehydrogenase (E3) component
MADNSCDVMIIGAGQAAEEIVERCCATGMRVFVAERDKAGGSCVNFGCTPTKTALESARVASLARRGEEFGIHIPNVRPDYARTLELARQKAEESNKGVTGRFGDKLIHGQARLVGREGEKLVVMVGKDRWLADKVVIDVGTRSFLPKIPGLADVPCITAENWLNEQTLPRRIALLGGGYISIEMCQFYRRMGAEEVTVVERGPQILAHEDPDVSGEVQKMLEAEGIRFRLNTKLDSIGKNGDSTVLHGPETFEVDALFVATGRKPNTDDLGLEVLGIEHDEKGYIRVDKNLRTNVPGVFASGDARGGLMFTHTAWDDARVIVSTLLGDGKHTTDRVVPYAVFIDPPLGRAGMSEADARKAGKEFETLRFEMSRNAHADEARQTIGSIKLLVEKETEAILGASVFGASGADLIHIYSLMMAAKLPASALRNAVIAHPTYAEAIQNVLL